MDHLKVENFLIGKHENNLLYFIRLINKYEIVRLKLLIKTFILFYIDSEPLHGIFVPFQKIVMAWSS